ncbi:MAG: NAD(P)H-dependent glycerol-3-phosphate dehydrogenase [Pseudomonadota bacterium]
MKSSFAILGAGSWGTALAQVVCSAGHSVFLWDPCTELIDAIETQRENTRYHPGIPLSKGIHAGHDLSEVASARFILLATPSHGVRETFWRIRKWIADDADVICAAKGLDGKSRGTLSAVAREELGSSRAQEHYTVLSGPSFAHEVIRGFPTALTVAAFNEKTGLRVQEALHTSRFQIYTSDDVIGVEISGALKNVIAITAGAADGFGYGYNARAGLITRGLHEIARIGTAMGAHPLTFSGLAGLGDLVLTCTGDLSRNRRVGLKLAQGKSLKQIMKEVGQVAEGIRTAKTAHLLAQQMKVDVPILEETYLSIYERKNPQQAIQDLLSREPQPERD